MKKFKIFDVKNKKFIEDQCWFLGMDGIVYNSTCDSRYDTSFYIAVQWTGCFDKNRVDVYEGDLAEWKGMIGRSEFFAGRYQLEFTDQTDLELGTAQISELEVVGNIYQNPELFKYE